MSGSAPLYSPKSDAIISRDYDQNREDKGVCFRADKAKNKI
jgi:hypothetical protein